MNNNITITIQKQPTYAKLSVILDAGFPSTDLREWSPWREGRCGEAWREGASHWAHPTRYTQTAPDCQTCKRETQFCPAGFNSLTLYIWEGKQTGTGPVTWSNLAEHVL